MMYADVENAIPFTRLLGKCDTRFGHQELPETILMTLNSAHQSQGESLEAWADRVWVLASKAFPDLPERYQTQQAIIRFCHSCVECKTGETVANQHLTSLEEAVVHVRKAIQSRRVILREDKAGCNKTRINKSRKKHIRGASEPPGNGGACHEIRASDGQHEKDYEYYVIPARGVGRKS